MKPSAPSFLKYITKRIHPPLLINPREATKLLYLLKTSFRQKLSNEHPLHSEEPTPTSAHLQSILSSPLFGKPNGAKGEENKNVRAMLPWSKVQESLISPIKYFNEQVAAGNMTLEVAKHCLRIQRENFTVFRHVMAPTDSAKDSSISHPILHWLWASSFEDSMEFVYDTQFLRLILPLLVSEGKDKHIWRWIRKLESLILKDKGQIKPDQHLLQRMSFILKTFIQATVTSQDSLSAGARCFNVVAKSFEALEIPNATRVLRASANYLSLQIMTQEPPIMIETQLYDEVQNIAQQSSTRQFPIKARLSLCHPTNPDTALALVAIEKQALKFPMEMSQVEKSSFVLLCLRVAESLVKSSQYSDAQAIMSIVQGDITSQQFQKGRAGKWRNRVLDSVVRGDSLVPG